MYVACPGYAPRYPGMIIPGYPGDEPGYPGMHMHTHTDPVGLSSTRGVAAVCILPFIIANNLGNLVLRHGSVTMTYPVQRIPGYPSSNWGIWS